MRFALQNIRWWPLTLLVFMGACSDTVTSETESLETARPRYTVGSDCDPNYEPNCEERPLYSDEWQRIHQIIMYRVTCDHARAWLHDQLYSGRIKVATAPEWENSGDWHWDKLIHLNERFSGYTDSWVAYVLTHEWGHHSNWNGELGHSSGYDEEAADSYANGCHY